MVRDTRTDGRWTPSHIGEDYADRARYVFDYVLNQEATQEMTFERTLKPLLPGVLEGYNATAFAYGVRPLRLVAGNEIGSVLIHLGHGLRQDAHDFR